MSEGKTAPQQFGYLAEKYCKRALPIQVCKSAAGFYIGTLEDKLPFSRESVEYWRTRKEAEKALHSNDWTQKPRP
jgi:hypothetical protein